MVVETPPVVLEEVAPKLTIVEMEIVEEIKEMKLDVENSLNEFNSAGEASLNLPAFRAENLPTELPQT